MGKKSKVILTQAGKEAQKVKGKKNFTKSSESEQQKLIADNRRAKHQYEILESLECGIVLRGSEVKSLRNGKCSLDEAYGRMRSEELWLVNCDIPEYRQASFWNHEPKRARKLLLNKQELRKFAGKSTEQGLTLVPLKLYFNHRGIAKCLMGICRGRKLHDKREVMKKKDAQRQIQRAMRQR